MGWGSSGTLVELTGYCLIYERGRQPDPGRDDPLVPISLEHWRAHLPHVGDSYA
ncbi:MAG TPA: hypothetical protein VGL75_05400 [Acidothermaceae bacterium]|jgi:hypothetical protein